MEEGDYYSVISGIRTFSRIQAESRAGHGSRKKQALSALGGET